MQNNVLGFKFSRQGRLGGKYCVCLQGQRIGDARSRRQAEQLHRVQTQTIVGFVKTIRYRMKYTDIFPAVLVFLCMSVPTLSQPNQVTDACFSIIPE
jgi:hypothetical protein